MTWRGDESRQEYLEQSGWADPSASPEPMAYLTTVESDSLVLDLWECTDRAMGAIDRVAVVVTMRPGIGPRSFDALPFAPWGHAGLVAIAWDADVVTTTPRDRLLEALWQGHLRARERFMDAEFRQVWPPT